MSEATVVELKNRLPEIERVARIADDFGQRHRLNAETSHNLKVALDEILTNTISYAYADAREHSIITRFYLEQGHLTVEVEDDGKAVQSATHPRAGHEAIAGRASDRRFGNSSRTKING